MQTWKIDGADKGDGHDRTLTIDAPDQKSAEAKARQQGLLVASVKPIKAKIVDHESPGSVDAVIEEPPARIVTGEGRNSISGVIAIVACAIVGLGFLAASFFPMLEGRGDRFKADNAVGATANAMEELTLLARCLIGVMFLILGCCIRIRGAMRSR
jgi:hypothetical protein